MVARRPSSRPGAREQQRAGADRSGAARRGRRPADPVDRLRVLEQRARAEAARDEQEVDAGRVGERVTRHEHEAAGRGDGLPRARDREDVEEAPSSLRRDSTPGSSRARESTSNGPATSSAATPSKIRMPTFQRFTRPPPARSSDYHRTRGRPSHPRLPALEVRRLAVGEARLEGLVALEQPPVARVAHAAGGGAGSRPATARPSRRCAPTAASRSGPARAGRPPRSPSRARSGRRRRPCSSPRAAAGCGTRGLRPWRPGSRERATEPQRPSCRKTKSTWSSLSTLSKLSRSGGWPCCSRIDRGRERRLEAVRGAEAHDLTERAQRLARPSPSCRAGPQPALDGGRRAQPRDERALARRERRGRRPGKAAAAPRSAASGGPAGGPGPPRATG